MRSGIIIVVLVTVLVVFSLLYYSLSEEISSVHGHHNHNHHAHGHPITNNRNNPEEEEPEITREQGLAIIEKMIRSEPYPKDCSRVLYFLEEFRQNKERWKVNRSDLRRIYRRVVPNIFKQIRQYAMTRRCTNNNFGYYLD